MRFQLPIIFLVTLLLASCSTVPLTDRSRLSLVSGDELIPQSAEQYSKVLKESKLSTNRAQKALLLKVGKRISAAAEKFVSENKIDMQFAWEFNLIEDEQVNAWAMPGGKIAFYTGIMPYLQTEAELAAVMGHEVAHVLAEHGAERMSHQMLTQGGLAILGATISDNEFSQAIIGGAALGAKYGITLPFSRKHEYEADELGAILMAMAGYDPRNATHFWQKMLAENNGGSMEFLATHPNSDNRITALNKIMPKALQYYNASKK